MRLFSTWSREKLTTWIQHLEEQLALGAVQISNPDTGSSTYSAADARRTLNSLYAALDRLDGKRSSGGWATYVPRIHPDR